MGSNPRLFRIFPLGQIMANLILQSIHGIAHPLSFDVNELDLILFALDQLLAHVVKKGLGAGHLVGDGCATLTSSGRRDIKCL